MRESWERGCANLNRSYTLPGQSLIWPLTELTEHVPPGRIHCKAGGGGFDKQGRNNTQGLKITEKWRYCCLRPPNGWLSNKVRIKCVSYCNGSNVYFVVVFFSLPGQPDSTVNEVFSRVRREASSAEDTTAKPRVLLLINLSLLVGLGRCRFELLYGNVLGTLFRFICYYDVAHQETGYKFRPPRIPIEEYDTTPLCTHAQPRNEESWSP